jgi:hypothetical protein
MAKRHTWVSILPGTFPCLCNGTPVADTQRCLELDGGLVLPELQELTHLVRGNTSDPFTSFVDAHQNAGPGLSQPKTRLEIFTASWDVLACG